MKKINLIELFDCIWMYPASAEQVLLVLADCGNKFVTTEYIERTCGLGSHEKVRIPSILSSMANSGLIKQDENGWCSILSEDEMKRIADMLSGAALYKRVHRDKDVVQIVLTLPELPSKLCETLPDEGPYCVKLGATDSVFTKIARDSKFRLVILTPFIDKVGCEWIFNMFGQTIDKPVERILIIRDYKAVKSMLQPYRDEIERLNVKLYDYFIHHNERVPPHETFHAKLILGDDVQAYIGSANMLESSIEYSLEVGVLVKGQSVLDINRLVNSILRASRNIVG